MYLETLKILIYYIKYLKQIHLLVLGMQPVISGKGNSYKFYYTKLSKYATKSATKRTLVREEHGRQNIMKSGVSTTNYHNTSTAVGMERLCLIRLQYSRASSSNLGLSSFLGNVCSVNTRFFCINVLSTRSMAFDKHSKPFQILYMS